MIERDSQLVSKLGWKAFVQKRLGVGDITNPLQVDHPARRLLQQYHRRGVPVKLSTPPCSPSRIHAAMTRGPHKYVEDHHKFLKEEFTSMINKGQWVILPYEQAKSLPYLRISPPGIFPQHERRPRWIGDYSYYEVNQDTLPISPDEAMQCSRKLERVVRHIVLADQKVNGPVFY